MTSAALLDPPVTASRLHTSLAASFKAANEGFLTRRRPAVVLELGLDNLVLQTEEAFSVGRDLVATLHIPARGSIGASFRVVRVEAARAYGRFLLTLAWLDIKDMDRERVRAFCLQLGSRVPAVAGAK